MLNFCKEVRGFYVGLYKGREFKLQGLNSVQGWLDRCVYVFD